MRCCNGNDRYFSIDVSGNLINPEVMRWFVAAVICAGAAWAGHGLKDMAVKEVRRSIVMLEMGTARKH